MQILDFSFSSIETHVVPEITKDPYTDPGSQAANWNLFISYLVIRGSEVSTGLGDIISYSMRAEWNMAHTQWETFIPHEAAGSKEQ